MPSLAFMDSVHDHRRSGEPYSKKDRGDYAHVVNSELLRYLRVKSQRSRDGEERVAWLRSQLVGSDIEFETPFGDRRLVYADQTASGRCLHYVENYIIQHVLPIYGNTHTEDSFVGSKITRMVHKATEYVRRCMGAGPEDAIVFCGSGSSAAIKRLQEVMGIAVPSTVRGRVIETLTDEERWVVFVGPYEHHSNLLSWRQSTAEVVEIGVDGDGLLDIGELRRELARPERANRPMIGSFSACSNVTGIVTDTRALARLLHRHGAFACFDFAASAPYVEIDMKSGDEEGYDAVFLSPHKFVGGPGTPGILLMNKALYRLGSSPPSTCGGGTVAYVNGFDEKDTLYYERIEEREDGGTPPIIQRIRASLAFWVKSYVGRHVIDLRERLHAESALRILVANPRILVLGNTQVVRLPIISFLVFPPSGENQNEYDEDEGADKKPLHGRFVTKLLNDVFGIQARGGCACAGPYGHYLLEVDEDLSLRIRSAVQQGYSGLKPGWTRISFCYYMSKEECSFIISAIEFIASYGHRFLPLYRFNWRTGDWTFRRRALKQHAMFEDTAKIFEHGETKRSEGKNARDRLTNKKTPKKNSGSATPEDAQLFESYLESARRIAHSLPDCSEPCISVPEGVDRSLILFRI